MFELPPLGYEYNALENYVSADIMKLHHSKHHQVYVDKLNKALEGQEEVIARISTPDKTTLESILCSIDSFPKEVQTALRNQGGGHYNHSLFWQWMSPDGGGQPAGELAEAINARYGSFEEFIKVFTEKSLAIFGSGWTWLQPDLEIMTTQNQDTPIMNGGAPALLGLDVWEHAYYLDYKNDRVEYIKAWWNVVDWDFVAERYASRSTKGIL